LSELSNAAGSLRKVIIVNTADEGGGSERMSMLTLEGFLERGIDTWLLVGDKKTDHPRVMPFYLSPIFDYRPFQGRAPRATRTRQACDARRWAGGLRATPIHTMCSA
jgi:hypothetical protein